MRNETRLSAPNRRYAEAHDLHYGANNLQAALELYREILVTDTGTPEAGYARSQIHNIVKAVVPEQTLLDAQFELAGKHLQHAAPTLAPPAPDAS